MKLGIWAWNLAYGHETLNIKLGIWAWKSNMLLGMCVWNSYMKLGICEWNLAYGHETLKIKLGIWAWNSNMKLGRWAWNSIMKLSSWAWNSNTKLGRWAWNSSMKLGIWTWNTNMKSGMTMIFLAWTLRWYCFYLLGERSTNSDTGISSFFDHVLSPLKVKLTPQCLTRIWNMVTDIIQLNKFCISWCIPR